MFHIRRVLPVLLAVCMLAGCGNSESSSQTGTVTQSTSESVSVPEDSSQSSSESVSESRDEKPSEKSDSKEESSEAETSSQNDESHVSDTDSKDSSKPEDASSAGSAKADSSSLVPSVRNDESSSLVPSVRDKDSSSKADSSSKTDSGNTADRTKPVTQNDIPVITITTKSTASNAIKFYTDTVAKHVSQQQAMWNRNYKMPPEPYYEDCTVSVADKGGKILINNADAQVKVRGNWTTSYPKKSLRIKFDKKQSMLGLNGGQKYKNWVLLAEYKDASMLRDKTALAAAREILAADGLYAADAEFIELWINGKFYGMYLLTELQQVNEGRVEITEPDENYKGTDIGYFLEFDGYYTSEDVLHRFYIDYNGNAPLIPYDGADGGGKTINCQGGNRKKVGFTIKSDIYDTKQRDFISNFVKNTYIIMYEAAYNDKAFVFNSDYSGISETTSITPREAVERVVDIDSLADMYVISELTCDADIYWSSFFMSVDFGKNGSKKLRFEAPWDFDSGLGNKNRCVDGTGFYAGSIVPDANGNEYKTCNPWLTVLMFEDWYQDVIREKWTRAYDNGVFDRAAAQITSCTDELADAFDRNYDKWNNIINNSAFRSELSSKAAKCKTQEQAAEYLSEWFASRVKFMNESWHK